MTLVDAEQIVATAPEFVQALQGSTAQVGEIWWSEVLVQSVSSCGVQVKEGKVLAQDRYMSNLFFIAPVYHLAFTLLSHLTVIDGTDLEFHQDLAPLQAELSHLTRGKLMAMGLDLSPNYFHMLTKYRDSQRRNFATFSLSPAGFPGQYQVGGRLNIYSIVGSHVRNKC